ncbi:MAG: MBG domain-containing protein [Pyrinomonadaceae bacterium]
MAPSLTTLTPALISTRLRLTVILSLVLALIALPSCFGRWIEPTASAAPITITVTNTNDSGPGSLKFAIVQANFNPGADTINFDLGPGAHTITLLSALSDIVDDVTITGPGSNLLTLQRSTAAGTPDFRIFFINNRSVNISGLTLTNGKTPDGTSGATNGGSATNGGGINASGALTLNDVVITGNTTGSGGAGTGGTTSFGGDGGFGGGISSSGTLLMTNCVISGNSTGNGGTGGYGHLGGRGGGLFAIGTATLTNVAIVNNHTGNGGVGINAGASGGNGGDGGGIYGQGTLNMTNVTVNGNLTGDATQGSTAGRGGGIFIYSGTTTLVNSTVSDNHTGSGSGFIGQGGFGGGIENNGTLVITGSTISSNTTGSSGFAGDGGIGGGILNNFILTLTNSTISGNVAGGNTNGGGNGGGAGGGILSGATLTLTNCTVTGNSAFNNNGNGISGGNSTTVRNTIIAGNGNAGAPDVSGTYNSQGNNLVGNSTGSTGFTNGVNGDQAGTSNASINPLLAALANYGGPTQTHALLPGSPAIDAGTSNGAPIQDQRGVNRVRAVDVGSFESQGFTIATTGGVSQSSPINTAFASPLIVTITSAFSEPITGGVVTFAAPASGASGTFRGATSFNTSINSSGQAGASATANGTAGGPYSVSAMASGASSARFSLTNLKGQAQITLGNLTQAYDGNPKSATPVTSPIGLNVTLSYSQNNQPVTSPVNVGSYDVSATINDPNYQGSATGTLVISKGTPTITWSNPPDITYGTALGNAQLNAAANVPGNFVYTPPNGTQLAAGPGQTLSVTFMPTDTTHYQSTPRSVSLNVLKATPTINVTGGTYTYDGNSHPATGAVVGVNSENLGTPTFTYNGSSAVPVNVGTYAVVGSFAGNPNYNGAISSTSVQIVIAEVPKLVQFSDSSYQVSENAGSATITVTRIVDASTPASVDYATSDSTAHQRSDYTLASGTLSFAAGEVSKTFTVLVTDNARVDGNRTVNLSLSNPVGAELGSQSTAVLTITDNDTAQPATNPIDATSSFVNQQYADFLNRAPDDGGLAFWSSLITSCSPTDQVCLNSKRVSVSAAFFIEQEFQLTGNYVYRMYKAAYGQRPSYAQFLPDRARINPEASQLEASKQQFANLFVQRAEFLAKYPASMTPDAFIDGLIATVRTETNGAVDLTSQRAALLSTLQASGRAVVVRQVAENSAFQAAEYNKAFVTMQYFGYLRRDPEDGGFNFWLNVLNNRVANNYRGMVCAFITSAEYQDRFSSAITRNDSICGSIEQ